MKMPKYVDAALQRRTRLAKQLENACCIVDTFLTTHGIDPDSSCWLSGVEIYESPDEAEEVVRNAIEKA